MSRSYKKHPVICNDRYTSKLYKKLANKKIRNEKYIPNHNYYRKLYNPYKICDNKKILYKDEEINLLSQLKTARQNNDKQKIEEYKRELLFYYKK